MLKFCVPTWSILAGPVTYVVKIVYEDYTVLMLKRHGGDALQVLAVCLLSTLLSIAIPAKYKVTESTTYS